MIAADRWRRTSFLVDSAGNLVRNHEGEWFAGASLSKNRPKTLVVRDAVMCGFSPASKFIHEELTHSRKQPSLGRRQHETEQHQSNHR